MDAVTALSASGPAYIYIILESLRGGGVKSAYARHCHLLAAQMALGAATMVLETGSHPALLKDAVTHGRLHHRRHPRTGRRRLRVTLIKAVMRAAQRAKELASS